MPPLTHLAIRLSDKVYKIPSAIHRHILVSCRHGAVWMGKPDHGLPRSLVRTLNCQIAAGLPTYLFIIDPDPCNQVMYWSELQDVSLPEAPPEKELVPGFYREMKMLSRIKAWLKIGDLTGFCLDEHPLIAEMNSHYTRIEEEILRRGQIGR